MFCMAASSAAWGIACAGLSAWNGKKGMNAYSCAKKEEGEILIPVIWQIGTQGDELHAGKGDA